LVTSLRRLDGVLPRVHFVLGDDAASRDIRLRSDANFWRLRVNEGVDVELSWDAPTLVVGQQLLLQRLADGVPVGAPSDLSVAGEVMASPGDFLIALGMTEQQSIGLDAGWNLIGQPLLHADDAAVLLAAAGVTVPAWRWEDGRFRPIRGADGLSAKRGVWIFGGTGPLEISGIRSDPEVVLRAGWNLVAFPGEAVLPRSVTVIYEWDSVDLQYRRVSRDNVSDSRRGYWVYSSEDAAVK
jgi:hypothetical protein